MQNFFILFKHEFKEYFPGLRKGSNRRDLVGNGLSLLIILILTVAVIFLFLSVVKTYLSVELNRVSAPTQRALELLNVLYVIITILLTFFSLEKLRKIITEQKDKYILLRLPVKSSTIFIVKFMICYLLILLMGLILILPVNIIIFMVLQPSWRFFLGTILSIFFLPSIPFFLATILVVPYIKILDFFNHRRILTLLFYITIIGLGFYTYSFILNILRKLLETGSIKYLFNEDFVLFLQNVIKFAYPINIFASITMGNNLLISWLVLIVTIIVVVAITYFLSKIMFYHTLYKNSAQDEKIRKRSIHEHSPLVSLLKKEFILTWRNNSNLFSYFAIALAMPLIVYCCFTLFQALLYNGLGLRLNFELGLLLTLIFIVLTNTYCSTNISRDGNAFLKTKAFPYKANKILFSKVLFCLIVSSISVIATTIMLGIVGNISILNVLVMLFLGILFSTAQILFATKLDLINAKLVLGQYETEVETSKTIAKLVFVGLVISLVLGIGLMAIKILLPSLMDNVLANTIAYLYVFIISIAYFVFAFFFYNYKLEEKYMNLVS